MNKETIKKITFYLIPFLILLFIFLSFYPGIFTYDGNIQWNQVTSGYMNNFHPFLSTYFQYLLSFIWNSNSVLLVFQIIVLTVIWGNILNKLYDNKNYKILIIYTALFLLCPIISLYAITTWKDVLYSYYLLSIMYYLYIGIYNDFKYTKYQYFIIGLLLFLIFNYRVNGMLVALLLLVLFYILIIKNKKEKNAKLSIVILIVFILFNGLLIIPKNYHINKYNEHFKEEVSKPGLSTLDLFLTWMMGSHLNKNYITEDDKIFLDKFINLEEWKKEYSPFLINGVGFIEDKDIPYEIENQKQFRNIFFKYSLRHPFTIAEHYIKADALLWSPIPVGYIYHYDFKFWEKNYSFEVLNTSKIKWFNKIYEKFTTLTLRRPVRVWFYQPAVMMYLSIVLCYLLTKALKNKRIWLLLTPMFANILSLMPINIAQDLRYVYINYLTIGFILLLVCINFTSIKKYLKKGNK